MKSRILKYIICFFLSISALYSQDARHNSTFKGNQNVISKKYNKAEVNYRKALSNSEKETKASHNLGNVLFENNNYDEAIQEYFKTQKNSDINLEKHSAFHNLGNSYMRKKDYAQAVDSYKNALRNNPEDDETRYNDQKDEQEKGGGLSKQQMENLLEAINNIENDVNKKVNANKKKVQTSKKSEKDW